MREHGVNPAETIKKWCEFQKNHHHMRFKQLGDMLICTGEGCADRTGEPLRIFYWRCAPEQKRVLATTDHKLRKCEWKEFRDFMPNLRIMCGECHAKLTTRQNPKEVVVEPAIEAHEAKHLTDLLTESDRARDIVSMMPANFFNL